jgi:hypothetical protein
MTTARFASKAVKKGERPMAGFNVLVVAALTACLAVCCVSALAAESAVKSTPARVEATLDGKIKKVTLTPKAAERIGIQIDEVRADSSGRRIVPYASVLYDLTGKTWVYISADPVTFFRGAVEIDTIKGDNVYLSDGPPIGTKVLSAGVPQVFGSEMKVGH